jgi:hypothetical protein
MKAYLPRWILAVILPIMGLVWALVTYLTFGTDSPNEQLSVAGWAVMTVILLLVGVMLWLMSSGRLPAYIVEVEDDEPPGR